MEASIGAFASLIAFCSLLAVPSGLADIVGERADALDDLACIALDGVVANLRCIGDEFAAELFLAVLHCRPFPSCTKA